MTWVDWLVLAFVALAFVAALFRRRAGMSGPRKLADGDVPGRMSADRGAIAAR